MKLSLNELKFISPAVLYGWQVERWTNRNGNSTHYWQGDPLFPVRIGKVMEKLLSAGYMEKVDVVITCYKATVKAHSLKCRACHNGKIFDGDKAIGDCAACNGIGLRDINHDN